MVILAQNVGQVGRYVVSSFKFAETFMQVFGLIRFDQSNESTTIFLIELIESQRFLSGC